MTWSDWKFILSLIIIRYGPITVNPRKQPSKTLFTGRRSKNEVLAGDEEEKRRVRRERNRVAATKCREKRESVLSRLEKEHDREIHRNRNLTEAVHQLQERKQYLLSLFSNQQTFDRIPTEMSVSLSQGAPLVFGDAAFLSSIMETPAPPLPPSPPRPQLQNLLYEEEQASHFRPPTPQLTNSAFLSEMVDPFFATDQQSQQQTYSMNSSSLDRLINELQPPHAIIDSNNLLTSQQAGLYNSAYGTSSCAQQHSSSSEDDSLTPARNNHIVY